MQTADTIVALATGWVASPRALIRLSGQRVPEVLAACGLSGLSWTDRALIQRTRLRIDRDSPVIAPSTSLEVAALTLLYPAGRSYTGEASAEIMIAGNPRLVERVIAGLTAFDGVRAASPGEFSARAYLNGRLTLAQAEGVAATIAARSQDELEGARRVMSGEAGRRHTALIDEVATLLALVEAGIDFTDQEDVVPIAPSDLAFRVREVMSRLEGERGATAGSERETGLPMVVLAGAPNAGKSTLFNALLGRRRTVVSDIAGTTRDVVVEELDLSDAAPGLVVELADLAGLDDSGDLNATDADAQHRAWAAIDEADVVVWCDPTGMFLEPLRAGRAERAVVRVRTKADRPTLDRKSWLNASAACDDDRGGVLSVCALDGWNLPMLRRAIADAAWRDRFTGAGAVLPRHRRSIAKAVVALRATMTLLEAGPALGAIGSAELVAGTLREALDALCELTGRLSPDDVIGRIFATFCIGK